MIILRVVQMFINLKGAIKNKMLNQYEEDSNNRS